MFFLFRFVFQLKLMENLVEEFRRISQSDRRIELKSMANICDELHQSIVFMNLIATSKRPPTNVEKPFRNILEETENNFVHISKYPPSFHQPIVTGRGNRQLIGSTNFSPVPSFSCRSIESSAKTESNKVCSSFVEFISSIENLISCFLYFSYA